MSAFSIVVYSLCAVYMVLNFKYDIQMLQQNSYRIPRYWKWLRSNIGGWWTWPCCFCSGLCFWMYACRC